MPNYSRFSCPNPTCKLFRETNQGNVAHRSWAGKNKNVERLRCTDCRKEFSQNKGTLQEKAKISVDQQKLLLKCHRWGVCEEGASDIAQVTRKTVRLFSKKAAKRAEIHHTNEVKNVEEESVQLDELHAKLAGGVKWLAAAIGLTSFMILAIQVGSRNQRLADNLLASVWARCIGITMVLTDGWACYYSAILRAFGRIYQPRRKEGKGQRKKKRIKFDSKFFYAQVVKGAKKIGKRWRLNSVILKAISGKINACIQYIQIHGFGNTIHTAHIERWFGSLRNSLACLRRKSRCPLKDSERLKDKIWIFVSLYNWVICHASLNLKGISRTPAMAAGLASCPLSYTEYIQLPVHEDTKQKIIVDNKIVSMTSEEMVGAAKRTSRPPPDERVIWKGKKKDKEAA